MKFAQYLQDTQTPEWEKAYIDYRGLKVQLGVIRAQALQQVDTTSSFGNTAADHDHHSLPSTEIEDDEFEEDLSRGITTSKQVANLWVSTADPMANDFPDPSAHEPTSSMKWRTSNHERTPSFSLVMSSHPHMTGTALNAPPQQTPLPSRTHRPPVLPRAKNPAPPLHTMISNLPAIHAKFFDMLDAELDKVVTFYTEREKEMHERAKLLKRQLSELAIHRRTFYESPHLNTPGWAKRACVSIPLALSSFIHWFYITKPKEPHRAGGNGILASELDRGGRGFVDTTNYNYRTRVPEHRRLGGDHSSRRDGVARGAAENGSSFTPSPKAPNNSMLQPKRWHAHPSIPLGGTKCSHDPQAYRQAKRRLRKAVAEHYRGLEVLNNYRILNLTGFRKALRKYEKITKTSVLDVYMKEKVEPSALASGAMVSTLLKEMESLFALRFEHGDKKKARNQLRVGPPPTTDDFRTFRFGLWLGLAIPAIVAGTYLSFQEYTRRTLLSWDIVLLIYSIFAMPVLMALLICVNILVWARNRLNYVFIFKLNPRLRHDHQEYFELPSFLLCTLAYGFWFSMAQLGPPMLWPLVWLALTFAVMFNPFHNFMRRGTRWWAIKKIAKLGASGIWNVEIFGSVTSFAALFTRFPTCTFLAAFIPVRNWGGYFLFGMLPFLVRFVQSLRRYRDSKLPGQLVNAGKYGMGIIQFFFYCYWRQQGNPHIGNCYILFCFTSTLSSVYGFAWDVAVDWSMCQPYAHYPLLRRELAYKSHISLYYFTLISNLCIRFIWLTYLLSGGLNIELRTFIAGMLEMLRRVQWNFYRVENKHLNNVEEYRITRELPLPYHFDAHPTEEETYIARLQLRKRLARLS